MREPAWLTQARREGRIVEGPATAPAKRAKRSMPTIRTERRSAWSITLTLPCRIVSEANRRDHWAMAKRRADEQKVALEVALYDAGFARWPEPRYRPPIPCEIVLTHIGRRMDGDNLQRGFKAIRDAVAFWLGIDDGDERVTWEYAQEPGKPGVRVTIANQPEGRT